MKRTFICDIQEQSSSDAILYANYSEHAANSIGIKNTTRIEFAVDIPDECFIKTIVIKETAPAKIIKQSTTTQG